VLTTKLRISEVLKCFWCHFFFPFFIGATYNEKCGGAESQTIFVADILDLHFNALTEHNMYFSAEERGALPATRLGRAESPSQKNFIQSPLLELSQEDNTNAGL
jgi:hypothetical protein